MPAMASDFDKFAPNKELDREPTDPNLTALRAEFGEYNETGGEQGWGEWVWDDVVPPHPWGPEC